MNDASRESDAATDTTTTGWEPSRWFRVTAPDGSLWCETSDEAEARRSIRPGDTLERLWRRTDQQWRTEPQTTHTQDQ